MLAIYNKKLTAGYILQFGLLIVVPVALVQLLPSSWDDSPSAFRLVQEYIARTELFRIETRNSD